MDQWNQEETKLIVKQALAGDAKSVDKIILLIQGKVYSLALQFLWHPQDAQDATQEILVKTVTNLNTFRFESAFSTWVYRIAVNHLLNCKRSRAERREISFEKIAENLQVQQDDFTENIEKEELKHVVKLACTNGMLLVLNRESRMAFLLGVIFKAKSEEAAQILGIQSDAYRQRVSRSRKAMSDFMNQECGLMNPNATCHCEKRIRACKEDPLMDGYVKMGESLRTSGRLGELEQSYQKELDSLERLAMIYQTNPEPAIPPRLLLRIQSWFKNSALISN